MNKKIYIGLMLLLTVLTFTSCTREDDIEEIFEGKTWYMNGGTINGMKMVSEAKNFYTADGRSAYYISFGPTTFTGVLSGGVTFSGTWTANGKNQTLVLTFKQVPNATTPFDKQIYSILKSTTSYKSGVDWLEMYDNHDNGLTFGDRR